jgi:hypothetical protein
MHARRLLRPAVALALSSLLAVAFALGASTCNLQPLIYVPNCFVPQLDQVGADGGPDPCHCNVPPPEQGSSCLCTSTQVVQNGLTGIQVFNECMSLLPDDAGDAAEGGPIPACNGQCWPIPPPAWTPILLWSGAESDAPACPYVAPTIVFAGNADDANGTFALGCASNASGSCPGFGDVCGPSFADGFLQCVLLDADLPCVSRGPYPDRLVFYESSPGAPILTSTFCCAPSPIMQP